MRSAAVPKLSTSEGRIYTVARRAFWGDPHGTGLLDFYDHIAVDAPTGVVQASFPIGLSIFFDTLQTAGLTMPNGVQF